MKLTKEDGAYLIYRGKKILVVDNSSFGRDGTESPSLTVYTLANGKRILPIHFEYDWVEIPGDPMTWFFKVTYPIALMRAEIMRPDYFWKTIPKDDVWRGGNVVVPFEIKDE